MGISKRVPVTWVRREIPAVPGYTAWGARVWVGLSSHLAFFAGALWQGTVLFFFTDLFQRETYRNSVRERA